MACVFTDFVDYLNTLHRANGDNVNATAEANNQSEFSKDLLVEDAELVKCVLDGLNIGSGKVILTGYAGDGKTTLAEIIARKLTGDASFSLSKERMIVESPATGKHYIIIKDLSANSSNYSRQFVSDITGPDALLLVSNTGTVMDRLLDVADDLGMAKNELKMEVLKGLKGSDEDGFRGKIELRNNISFDVFNLVRHDNLETARKVLIKMINHPAWDIKPIMGSVSYFNVQLLKLNDNYAVDRMFDIYRYLYAYGERLTMRQFLEHFAYTITGAKAANARMDTQKDYFFVNFFGEQLASRDDTIAKRTPSEIKAVQLVSAPAFGGNMSSRWKKNLWMASDTDCLDEDYSYRCPDLIKPLFLQLKRNHNGAGNFSPVAKQARLNIQRIHFFLNQIDGDAARWDLISSFLDSPGYRYLEESRAEGEISSDNEERLLEVVRSCLKEFLLGMRIPISSDAGDDNIYIPKFPTNYS